ncbi:Cadmium, cobalt and zinc/H(+)-K(+) antiporter [compost metagenome]
MEGTPSGVELEKVKSQLEGISGVIEVHDLHAWSITSGMNAFSCHLVTGEELEQQRILQEAIQIMEEKFNIGHTTIQIETPQIRHQELLV